MLLSQFVSLVVPAYNAGKRIEPTLLSIAAQDYKNMEIIVVDDGSSDDTCDVAESVLTRSGREFSVVKHETNMGVSVARNTGLDSASGDYVIFFDADDLADHNFVSVLVNTVTKNDSDMAFCGYRNRFEKTGEERIVPVSLDSSRSYSTEDLTAMYIFKKIKPAIWSTIFKLSFLREMGLKFTVSCRYGEDTEFLTKAFSRCGSINFSAECHYIYVHHENMTSKTTLQAPDKHLRRYTDNAEATYRAALYLAEHAGSPKVRGIAMNFMLAEGFIKTLNVASMRRDEAQFRRMLDEPETRRALLASRWYFFQKPGLFMKAALLLFAPGVYFRMRSKP